MRWTTAIHGDRQGVGDLLYQITLHSQVAAEQGTFTIEDVFQNIIVKLIGRHPHVFGDMELESAQDVLNAWESFKQRQKPKRESVFEGIPADFPPSPNPTSCRSVPRAWDSSGRA